MEMNNIQSISVSPHQPLINRGNEVCSIFHRRTFPAFMSVVSLEKFLASTLLFFARL